MDYFSFYKKSNCYSIVNADIKTGMVNHAYMLVGKDTNLLAGYAKLMAKHILCNFNNSTICLKVDNNNHSDVKTFPYERNNILTEDIKNIVNDSVVYPLEGDRKLFILNNFDTCVVQAQNKLLKTLEEPSSTVTFILTTSSPYNVLPTIKSRCKVINVENPHVDDVVEVIVATSQLNRVDAEILARNADMDLSLIEKRLTGKYQDIRSLVFDLLVNMNTGADILAFSNKVASMKDRVSDIFDELSVVFRDIMVVNIDKSRVVNTDKLDIITKASKKYDTKASAYIIKLIGKEKQKIRANCSLTAVIDDLLMKILEVKAK